MVYLSRCNSTSIILVLVGLFLNGYVLGAPPASSSSDLPRTEPGVLYLPDAAIVIDDGYELSIQGVLGSIVLIVIAVMLWARGAINDISRSLVGMVVLGFVAWLFLANFEPAGTYGTNRWTIYLTVPIACGLVGICFMTCIVPSVTLMLLGGLGGVASGLWVLGWRDNLTVHSDWGRAVLLVILAILGCAFASFSHLFHVIGAAFTGAYILMLGLDIYFHTGFTYCFLATFDSNPAHATHYSTTRETHIIHAVLIVAAIVGIVVQSCIPWDIVAHHERAFGNFNRGYPKFIQRGIPSSYHLPAWLPLFHPHRQAQG